MTHATKRREKFALGVTFLSTVLPFLPRRARLPAPPATEFVGWATKSLRTAGTGGYAGWLRNRIPAPREGLILGWQRQLPDALLSNAAAVRVKDFDGVGGLDAPANEPSPAPQG